MDLQFWAVLGGQGCREKKNTNCHKYATFEFSFYVIIAKKTFFFTYLLIKRSVRVVFTICLPQNDEHLWRGQLMCCSGFSLYVLCMLLVFRDPFSIQMPTSTDFSSPLVFLKSEFTKKF